MTADSLVQWLEELFPGRYAPIRQEEIVYDPFFRTICEKNSCGKYGRNYACPPAMGTVEEVLAEIKQFPGGFLYQTVFPLEDSFDFEGMIEAKKSHEALAHKLQKLLRAEGSAFLHFAAGGCSLCPRCAMLDKEPCRFPELLLPSMEAYIINVSQTAKNVGLRYTNGENTVTYFGLVLFGG